jgi:hypothetical protein
VVPFYFDKILTWKCFSVTPLTAGCEKTFLLPPLKSSENVVQVIGIKEGDEYSQVLPISIGHDRS